MASKTLSKLTEGKTKRVTLAIFAIDVIILIVVLIILWTMPDLRTPGESCGYMCLPCTTGVCCGCRGSIMNDYMKMNFEKSYKKENKEYEDKYQATRHGKIYGGYIGDVKPVAHMIGKEREPADTQNALPVTKWFKGNNCLLLNGMSMSRGRLRVPASGYYHVYSMLDISYHLYKKSDRQLAIPTDHGSLIHSIYRSNIYTSTDDEILSTYHPYEFSKNGIFGRFDTYLSSDMYLNAGDEVYVKVSNISQVNSPPKNVLGIYMI